MTIRFRGCVEDDDFAQVSLYMVEHRRDLHPSLCTIDMVTILYGYMSDGHLHYGVDEDGRIVGASGFYIQPSEEGVRDRASVLIDVGIVDKERRGTRLFLRGMRHMIDYVSDHYPEVEVVRLCALSDNPYLCKLYAKIAPFEGTREGSVGQESMFSGEIHRIRYILNRLNPL
ncbi:GNAT family N-acetyltransferase [Cohnella sp.]|uniref:GNAT family N-acetyltransferase n=1 Tax=Cohnella sp. TaxID=1883426 RepID=UPI00356408D6